jgi:hypothetical protein
MRYKRLSRFSKYFVSPKFWLFGWKMEFFNKPRDITSICPDAAAVLLMLDVQLAGSLSAMDWGQKLYGKSDGGCN